MTDVAHRATFTAMDHSTAEEWAVIAKEHDKLVDGLADQILDHLKLLDGDFGGFAVDRLTHSLQTAARAEADGQDDAYIVSALLHDIGDTLAPSNHPDVAASILKAWVPEPYHWMVQHHGIFQGYYFWHHLGGNRDAREEFRGHEHFELTAEFCARYDQVAFDPDYATPPLEHYEPLVRDIFRHR
ncbi:MAG: HD domain-containing protein [Actinomycetota bacterium]